MNAARVVAVSPHLDDAAFSAGGTLAGYARDGIDVTVITCFTGSVAAPTGFALACQLDKGLPPEVDYMALRRAEDGRAWAVIGASYVHLPLLEAPHRGYADAAALFGARLPGDDVVAGLCSVLAPLLGDAPLVLGPLGIGDHVDHHAVREALRRMVEPQRLLLWEDWPYLDRAESLSAPSRVVDLDAAALAARIAMCSAYQSQLGFQFGGQAELTRRLEGLRRERFHRAG